MEAGYTAGEFWGLVVQTLCLPAAAVALVTFLNISYKSQAWSAWVRSILLCWLVPLMTSVVVGGGGGGGWVVFNPPADG